MLMQGGLWCTVSDGIVKPISGTYGVRWQHIMISTHNMVTSQHHVTHSTHMLSGSITLNLVRASGLLPTRSASTGRCSSIPYLASDRVQVSKRWPGFLLCFPCHCIRYLYLYHRPGVWQEGKD